MQDGPTPVRRVNFDQVRAPPPPSAHAQITTKAIDLLKTIYQTSLKEMVKWNLMSCDVDLPYKTESEASSTAGQSQLNSSNNAGDDSSVKEKLVNTLKGGRQQPETVSGNVVSLKKLGPTNLFHEKVKDNEGRGAVNIQPHLSRGDTFAVPLSSIR